MPRSLIWDEPKAQLALQEVNKRVAGAFGVPVQEPKILFVKLIDRREWIDGQGNYRRKETLGTCDRLHNTIKIVANDRWPNTAIHELAHFYVPQATEKRIHQITEDMKSLFRWAGGNGGGQIAMDLEADDGR